MKSFVILLTAAGVLVFIGIGLYARFANLDQFLAPDEERWYANVSNFTTALAHAEFGKTYQLPHPGITLQWFAAPTVHTDSWTGRKLSLVATQSMLLLITGYIFYRLWGAGPTVVLVLLLTINPLLVAHTRVYAMDSLLAIFLLLSLGCLLLWKTTNTTRYIVFSGIAGALAILSKLPGIIIVPFSLLVIGYWHRKNPQSLMKWIIVWFVSCVITLPLVFPALAVRPQAMIQNMLEFFSSDDYTELHPASNWYYARTLIFFSTPIQMAALIVLPFIWKKLSAQHKEHAAIFIAFAAAFVLMMGLGSKMGDRYILPVFLLLDVVTAISIWYLVSSISYPAGRHTKYQILNTKYFIVYGLIALFVWQTADIIRLHPYTLAYVNPVTKPFFGDRRLGWGEGLDIAATYLHAQPNSGSLTVASYYPNQFGEFFDGEVVALHEWDNGRADYAVLYRAQLERGQTAWETDVLTQFQTKTPEKVITLNGLEYVWIYNLQNN